MGSHAREYFTAIRSMAENVLPDHRCNDRALPFDRECLRHLGVVPHHPAIFLESYRHRAWLRGGAQRHSVRASITNNVSVVAGAYHSVLAGSTPKVVHPVAA